MRRGAHLRLARVGLVVKLGTDLKVWLKLVSKQKFCRSGCTKNWKFIFVGSMNLFQSFSTASWGMTHRLPSYKIWWKSVHKQKFCVLGVVWPPFQPFLPVTWRRSRRLQSHKIWRKSVGKQKFYGSGCSKFGKFTFLVWYDPFSKFFHGALRDDP